MTTILYIHGFASGPASTKAQFFLHLFEESEYDLRLIDLNQGQEGFRTLTLSRQIAQVEAALPEQGPVYLIGSSFGGLTASWVATRHPKKVAGMILLAPAFQFLARLRNKLLTNAQMETWQRTGVREVEHYTYQRMLPLQYDIVTDMETWQDQDIRITCPTMICYGLHDETIPASQIIHFAHTQLGHTALTMIPLDADHSLAASLPRIGEETRQFLTRLGS